jgi:hypothetical protein
MEEYGVLRMVVEVGICVGQETYLDLDDWWYLYAITTARKEREAAIPPACLPDDCQLGTTDRQADRTHGDVEAACRVDSCASVLVVSSVCSSVFAIDRGLTSQVHISTLHRPPSVQRHWGNVPHPHGQVATIYGHLCIVRGVV